MSNPLLVGIDVHRQTNTVALSERTGRQVAAPVVVQNDRPGIAALAGLLQATAERYSFSNVANWLEIQARDAARSRLARHPGSSIGRRAIGPQTVHIAISGGDEY